MSDLFEMEIEPDPAENSYAADVTQENIRAAFDRRSGEDQARAIETAKRILDAHVEWEGQAGPMAPEAPTLSLATVLPQGFNLLGLLQFLPDVKMKQGLDAAAAKATTIKVVGRDGVQSADAALGDLKDRMKAIDLCFDGTEAEPGPTALAYQLHKRLTGLRGDFKAQGTLAVATLSTAIARETRRLDDEAVKVQREEQAKADQRARDDARRAAAEARLRAVPAPIVEALEQAAQTATAPPVATTRASAPVLAHSTVVEKQKARLIGTGEDAEPNPEIAAMTETQRHSAMRLVCAVAKGEAPLELLELNWPRINARAEGSALGEFLPGVEAFKARSTRGRGRR